LIKDLIEKQVVCSQRNEKGKACHGGLKRYHPFADYYNEVDPDTLKLLEKEFGREETLVLLKCEECSTVYRLPEILERRHQAQ
jgi:hypothetical protein